MTEEQIGNFVDHWYQAARPAIGWDADTAAGRGSLLKQAIQQRPYLADLASRPLLLTLTAAIDTGGGKLPEDRAELYEEAVNLLLLRWQRGSEILDADGNLLPDDQIARVKAIPEDQKRRALEKLAYQVHKHQGQAHSRSADSADIPAADIYAVFNPLLPDDINARVLLGFLENRAGLLIGRYEEVYTFLHRSFQEYLAGCYLVSSDDFAPRMKALMESDRDWWREVCLLAVGKAGRAMPFALSILDEFVPGKPEEAETITIEQLRLAALTGIALLELRIQERASESEKARLVKKRTSSWLVNILQNGLLPESERAAVGSTLARLGDPRSNITVCESMEFCHVSSGEFIYGNRKEKRLVKLPEFWIGKYPVTVSQYCRFVECGGYANSQYWPEAISEKYWTSSGFKGGWDTDYRLAPVFYSDPFCLSNHPIVGVSWYEAMAFTRWLSKQMLDWVAGLSGEPWQSIVMGKLKMSLPTHEQWEKAARGTDGQEYPWGNRFCPDMANTEESGIRTTTTVGIFPAGVSPFGVLDMIGNVFEWVASTGDCRGGSWRDKEDSACRAIRNYYPDLRDWDVGFRVCIVSVS